MDVPARRRAPAPSTERSKRITLRSKQVLSLGVILALLGPGCASGGQLGAEALMERSKSLQSIAAEGTILAQDAVSGKTTDIFIRVHSSDLDTAASQVEASLMAAETEPALEPMLRELAVIATKVSADLKRLGSASKNEDRALARELQAAAQASQRIGEGLT
jgi:hypothetical protein